MQSVAKKYKPTIEVDQNFPEPRIYANIIKHLTIAACQPT